MNTTNSYPRNAWYQAAWSHEIIESGTLSRTILDTPVLLLRGGGKVSALLDRCPHRFAPLSRGRFDGTALRCGYHGLSFDVSGTCIHNPHGAIPARAQVLAFPLVEKHAGLWIWLGDAAKADISLIPDVGFIDATPATALSFGHMHTPANWQLIVDNLLDLAHSDYLHPAFGNFMTSAKTALNEHPDGMSIRWEAKNATVPLVFKILVPEGAADMWVQADWNAPSVIGLEAGATPTGVTPKESSLYSYHALTPETMTTTHYFYGFARNFRTGDRALTTRLGELGAHAFEHEDKPMISAQQQRIGVDGIMALHPVYLTVDAGPMKARRKVQTLIEAESRASRGGNPASASHSTTLPTEA